MVNFLALLDFFAQKNGQFLSIVGFLCVDSSSTGTFSRNDISLIRSIADCLYRPVYRYSQLRTASQQKRNKQGDTIVGGKR